MRRILFVDDEPRILEGLQRMLRSQRREWEMVFAVGGAAALEQLESGTFDVILSDMRMPGMDGATLLARVQERSPETVRMVLSGQMDPEAATRAVRVAHQFLSKPCSAEVLKPAIQRACGLRDLLRDERVRQTVGQVDSLPAVPLIYTALVEVLSRPDGSAQEVADLLEQDVAMSAKVLQLVNSSFFGLSRQVTDMHRAVSFLGTRMIQSLVLSTEAFGSLQRGGDGGGDGVDALHHHSLAVANVAHLVLGKKELADDAYAAGMLHDIGKLVLADRLPEEFARANALAREQRIPLYQAEDEVFGVTHAEVGAYLLGLWNLPLPVVEAVAHHHAPQRVPHDAFDLPLAVHVADALTHEVGASSEDGVAQVRVDESYLESLGLLPQLAVWRAGVRDQAWTSEEEG